MSRYDTAARRLNELLGSRRRAIGYPAMAAALLAAAIAPAAGAATGMSFFALPLLAACATGLLTDRVLQRVSAAYRREAAEFSALRRELAQLRSGMRALLREVPRRRKGQPFKAAHRLRGLPVDEFEKRLALGMCAEGREVFVAAFVRAGVVVRVTASIGSAFGCRASDDVRQWSRHVERLRCDEIRQYHNHPVFANETAPSARDRRATAVFRRLLGGHGDKLKSYIIYWNEIREWRILEYDERSKSDVVFAYDAGGARNPFRPVCAAAEGGPA